MTPTRLLIALDFDDPVKPVSVNASAWARNTDAKLSILGVVPKLSAAAKSTQIVSAAKAAEQKLRDNTRNRLAELNEQLDSRADVHMASGATADKIIEAAILNDAELILKTADTPVDKTAPLFRSVEKRLIRKSPLPVWITRKETDTAPQSIAVAVDNITQAPNRPEAEIRAVSLIDHAVDLAARFEVSDVYVIHAWSVIDHHLMQNPRAGLSAQQIKVYVQDWEDTNRAWLKTFVKEQQARIGDKAKLIGKLVGGDAQTAISEALSDLGTDLLVIGSANRTGLPGLLLGNTAEEIINCTECDIYVVKSVGFSSLR